MTIAALQATPVLAQVTPEEQLEPGTTAAANEGSPAAAATVAEDRVADDAVAAEEAAVADESGLDIITVTGTTKKQENTLDVPATITAFSGEALETKNAVQVADVATYTPGFSVNPAPGNATALTLAIRGQVQNDILATLEPSVGTYVDELYWARAYGLNAGLVDTASVQVLKGPQGTLFGRNTTGGALVIASADPNPDEFTGKVSVTYGRYDEMVGEMIVNLPIGETFAVRGALKISHRDGWAYGVRSANAAGAFDNTIAATTVVRDGRRYNDRNELQGRVKALWEISDDTTFLVSGEWYDYSSDGPARSLIYKVPPSAGEAVANATPVNLFPPFFADNPNAVGVDAFACEFAINQNQNCTGTITRFRRAYTYANTETYIAKLTHDFSFGTFKLIGGYRNVYTDNFIDLDGSPVNMHATSLTQDLSQKSVEAQLAGTVFDDALDYVVGATYFNEDGSDLSYSLTGAGGGAGFPAFGSVPARATRNFGFIDNDSIGIYTQLKFHISDAISVYGGLRYSEDTKRLDLRSANVNLFGVLTPILPGGDPCNAALVGVPLGATAANDCSANKKAKFDSISWTAGVDFKPVEDVLLYAKISKGYRSGGHNLRAFNDVQFTPFQPETVIEEEVGFKGELFDRRLRVQLAAYHNVISDAQRTTIVVSGAVSNTLIGNAAKVRNYGAEAELLFELFDGLTLSASGSINDAKYLSYPDTVLVAGVPVVVDRSNERFQFLPREKFSLGANYDTDFGDVSFNANIDYSWTSKQASGTCALSGPSICFSSAALNGATATQISQAIIDASTLSENDQLSARVTLGFNDDMFKLAVFGKNLLDDRGFGSSLTLIAPGRNYVSGIRRDPRTYGITASVAW